MGVLFPALAAVMQAVSFTLDKVVLTLRRVNFELYLGVSFPLSFAITAIIFFLLRPSFSFALLSGKFAVLVAASIGLSFVTNLLFYRALEYDRLGEIETFNLLHNVPIIIVSSVFFTDERNFWILVPALAASLAVFWSHWEHHHLIIRKRTRLFLVWSLAIAPLGAGLSKTLLAAWNPISLELVRSGALAILFLPFLIRYGRNLPRKGLALLVLTNVFTTIAWILFYFGYQRIGVVHTLLVFSLQPFLVYLASLFFLKEPFAWKKAAAFAVVLAAISIAQIGGRT